MGDFDAGCGELRGVFERLRAWLPMGPRPPRLRVAVAWLSFRKVAPSSVLDFSQFWGFGPFRWSTTAFVTCLEGL